MARRQRVRPPALHDADSEDAVSRSWAYNSLTGSLQHRASGMRVSPCNGIQCDGREYKLAAEDIEIVHDKPLGSGASGTVWLGRIKTTGTPVAIKTLKVHNSDERKSLLNEVRTLIEAEGCPYLVQWHAGFSSRSTRHVHLVLELMDFGSLASLRTDKGIPPRILAAIACQVLQGIEHLHSRQLLHNDIKPGNILLNTIGEVKITDFGITTSMENSMHDACRGTQIYVSPEKAMAGAGAGYSLPADVWSFGIVCYELATGEHPLASADSIPAIFDLLCNEPEPRLPESAEHPAVLCDFVAQSLTRDVTKRATASELLKHNFIACAASRQELSEWLEGLALDPLTPKAAPVKDSEIAAVILDSPCQRLKDSSCQRQLHTSELPRYMRPLRYLPGSLPQDEQGIDHPEQGNDKY